MNTPEDPLTFLHEEVKLKEDFLFLYAPQNQENVQLWNMIISLNLGKLWMLYLGFYDFQKV